MVDFYTNETKKEEPINSDLLKSGSLFLSSPDIVSSGVKIDAGGAQLQGRIELSNFFTGRQIISTSFESLDGLTVDTIGSGSTVARLGSLYMFTGSTSTSNTEVTNGDLSVLPLKFGSLDSTAEFGLAIPLLTGSAYKAFWGVGTIFATDGTGRGYGFKADSDTLYALRRDVDGEVLVAITGITLGNFNVYRAVNSVVNKKIEYFVNGVLKAAILANFDTQSTETRFYLSIENQAAANREIYVAYATFAQE